MRFTIPKDGRNGGSMLKMHVSSIRVMTWGLAPFGNIAGERGSSINSLVVQTVLVEPPFRLEGISKGDLEGSGKWRLERLDNQTSVRYDWVVKTNKKWMNLLYPVAYPFFKWNHNSVMDEGFKGLRKRLNRK